MPIMHESWRAATAVSRYPFEDRCNLTTVTGLVLPRAAVLDAAIHPPNPGPFVVGSIDVNVGQIRINFWNTSRSLVAIAQWDVGESPTEVEVQTPEGNPAGVLVTDPVVITSLRGWPRGTHVFPDGSASLVASVCTPAAPSGLLGIRVGDEVFSGHVHIVGENGIVFSAENDGDGGVIVRYDVVGDPLFFRNECEPAIQEEGEEGLLAKEYLRGIRLIRDRGLPTEQEEEVWMPLASTPQGNVNILPAYTTTEVDPGSEYEDAEGAPIPALRISAYDGVLRITLAGLDG